jgi:hypothetical protein
MMRSLIHVRNRRFGIAMFPSFYGTRPTHEEEAATPGRIADLIVPDDGPMIVAEKDRALYFVPCVLKDAPLTGKTLIRAQHYWLPTVGKMRSGNHVTAGAWAKLDGDGLTEGKLAAVRAMLSVSGVAHLIYSTHSHGRTDRPGIRCRIIVFFDKSLEPADYQRAVLSLSTWLLGQSLDASEALLCQQAGAWCAHPDRVIHAFCIRQLDGVCVSTDSLLAAAPPETRKTMKAFGNTAQLPLDAARIGEALKWIGPNEYKAWTDCAIWLKAAFGDQAFPLWLEWSKRADQEAQAQNEGRYAPDKVWAGITPRITGGQGAGALYGNARDNAVAAVCVASDTGQWSGQGKAALVYLKRFHPRKFDDLFGAVA